MCVKWCHLKTKLHLVIYSIVFLVFFSVQIKDKSVCCNISVNSADFVSAVHKMHKRQKNKNNKLVKVRISSPTLPGDKDGHREAARAQTD